MTFGFAKIKISIEAGRFEEYTRYFRILESSIVNSEHRYILYRDVDILQISRESTLDI
jgi:hypothetical protein